MNTLRERMHETVDSRHTDLAALVERSRIEGTTLRRRRRLATAGAALAVLAVVGAGALAAGGLLPGGGMSPVASGGGGQHHTKAVDKPAVKAHHPQRATPGTETRQADGRLTAAALYAAVTGFLPGTVSDVIGQGAAGGAPDTYGQFAFAPADGSGAGRVGLNLQSSHILDDPQTGLTAEQGFVCAADYMGSCQVRTLPDGSLLRTYAEHSVIASGGTGERLVAERLVGGVRVVAAAENGFSGPSNTWDITRPDAVLSTAQLVEVVSQPWWAFQLPTDFPGSAELPSYTELPSS